MRTTVRDGLPVVGITGHIVTNADAWAYRWLGLDCTCCRDVQEALPQDGGRVIVEIDSPGGSVTEGAAIYTELMNHSGELTLEITGMAASAASVIAQAKAKKGAICRISPVALMMIHNVQLSTEGDYRDMEKAAGTLRTANQSIINAYCISTGKSEEEVRRLLDEESWFSAQEAVEAGLADEIMFVAGLPDMDGAPFAALAKAQAKTLMNSVAAPPREVLDRLLAQREQSPAPPTDSTTDEQDTARARLALERARF